MELEQLKTYWQTEQEKQINTQTLNKQKLETLMNTIESNLHTLQQKNEQWYKLTLTLYKMVALVWGILLVIYLVLPDTKSHINIQLLAHLLFVILISATAIWSMRRQKEIFDTANGDSLVGTLHEVIKKFKRFYLVVNLIFLVLLPAYFYILIAIPTSSSRVHGSYARLAHHIDIALPGTTLKVLCCLAATLTIIALSHWYYYRAYFKRIAQMQQSLDELSASGA
jgi:Flp pilus assembly protein TadB